MAFDFKVFKSHETKIFDIIHPATGEVLCQFELYGPSTAEYRTAFNRVKAASQSAVIKARKEDKIDTVSLIAEALESEIDALIATVKRFIGAEFDDGDVGEDKEKIERLLKGVPFVRVQVSNAVEDTNSFLENPDALNPKSKAGSNTSDTKPGSARAPKSQSAPARKKPQN